MELKQHVVDLVDEDCSVRLGLSGSNAAPCKTLRSLSLVDRLFERLVSPLLWHVSLSLSLQSCGRLIDIYHRLSTWRLVT